MVILDKSGQSHHFPPLATDSSGPPVNAMILIVIHYLNYKVIFNPKEPSL